MSEFEPRHTFSGGDLDRAAHLRDRPAALETLLESPGSLVLPFCNLDPLVRGRELVTPAWQPLGRVRSLLEAGADLVFLGVESGSGRFALGAVTGDSGEPLVGPGCAYRGVRGIASLLSPADASTVALARSLLAWAANHRFCPRCGAPTEASQGGHQRVCANPDCRHVQFPRIDPVVIMLIHRGVACLMGRAVRSRRYPPGLYSCLAGYVEPGESIEEAVRREVREEAGLPVGRVRYHSSQPWPFPSQLMIGCFAEALEGDLVVDPLELEAARWLDRLELQSAVDRWMDPEALRLPPPLTIAHQLAKAWLAGQTEASR